MALDCNIYEIALGALLHDVGKTGQRAFRGEGLAPESAGLEASICPKHKNGYYTHRHVLYTNEFCENALTSIPHALDRKKIIPLAIY